MTIPDDVMKMADAAAVALADRCTVNPGWHEIRVRASEHIASAIMAERSRKVTAFLDGILADRGARNRIIMAAKAAERAEEQRMWSGVEGRESKHGNPEQALVSGVIAALKQEAGS